MVDFPDAVAIDNETLLSLDVDLLVPAAVEGVLHAENAGSVRARVVVGVQASPASWWSETEVEARLADRMTNAWQQVLAESARRDLPLRTAATCLAVRRVAEAHRQRGLYP